RFRYAAAPPDRSQSRTTPRPWAPFSAARQSPSPARTARRWIVRRASAGRLAWLKAREWTFRRLSPKARKLTYSSLRAKRSNPFLRLLHYGLLRFARND